MCIFDCTGGGAPNPDMFKGQLHFTYTLKDTNQVSHSLLLHFHYVQEVANTLEVLFRYTGTREWGANLIKKEKTLLQTFKVYHVCLSSAQVNI